jgi:hypothetical protein
LGSPSGAGGLAGVGLAVVADGVGLGSGHGHTHGNDDLRPAARDPALVHKEPRATPSGERLTRKRSI